ncbi:glycosyltransferase [Acinetobacter sp. A47]|uniref:glycosyltransferase n=1 Tax=Acinetobacter sp. A47 TaxID=1561217 RepID=UPI00056FF8D0|nr:glycosyltransferase [Acinetobacter sp. A47]
MKVLILVPDLAMGGVTTIVKNLVNHLKKRNYQVVLVSIFNRESKFLDHDIKTLGVQSIFDLPKAILKLRKIFLDEKPDLIHSHTIFSHLLGCLVKKFFLNNIVLVCTEHGTLSASESKTLYMKIFKKINNVMNLITFVSYASLKSYKKYKIFDKEVNSQVIYNGIDVKRFQKNDEARARIRKLYSIDKEALVFGSFGRLAPEKNIGLFLNALARLKENISFKVFLIGDGAEKENIFKKIQDLNLKNELIYIPFTEHIEDYINAIDVLCLSSTTEGLPTVIIEAMSCEKIVVSTNVGGVTEILPENDHFLVNSNDEIALSKQLVKASLLKNNSEIGSLYHKIAVERFSVEVMLEQWIQVYEQLCFKHS